MEGFTVKFNADINDFICAINLGWPRKKRFGKRFWFYISICIFLSGVIVIGDHQSRNIWLGFLPLIIVGTFILFTELSSDKPTKRWIESKAKERGGIEHEHTFAIDESGITNGWGGAYAKIEWKLITKFITSQDMFVFIEKLGGIAFVPTRALTIEQIEAVKGMAASNIVDVEKSSPKDKYTKRGGLFSGWQNGRWHLQGTTWDEKIRRKENEETGKDKP